MNGTYLNYKLFKIKIRIKLILNDNNNTYSIGMYIYLTEHVII